MGQFQKARVGNAELIVLQDTWRINQATTYFEDIAEAALAPFQEFIDDDGNILLSMGCWLIRSEGQTVLVDTGLGERPVSIQLGEPPALPRIMREAGVQPEDIDVVVFTHLHYDHSGWNTVERDGRLTPLFANARYLIHSNEWNYWTGSEALKEKSRYEFSLAPVEQAGLLDLFEGEKTVTSEVVVIPTPGHTPGHVSLVVASGGERAYVLGDVALHPIQLTETDWCKASDIDRAQAVRTRHALLDRIERENALIAAGHFPFPSMGRAVRGEDGRRSFQPID